MSQLHEGVSIDLWYQHAYFRHDVYIQVISHCMKVSYISVKLYYTITELVACLCVYFYSKLNPTLSLPAICSYTWISIYTQTCTATWWPTHAADECPCSPSMQCVVKCFSRAEYICLFSAQYKILYARIRRMIIHKLISSGRLRLPYIMQTFSGVTHKTAPGYRCIRKDVEQSSCGLLGADCGTMWVSESRRR